MKVYLADLDYFTEGNRIETPLGIGFIKSYCQPLFPNVKFKLFKNPELLIEAIRKEPPDILGLSCFVWNVKLNDYVIDICPDSTTIVAGGPNSRLCNKADCIVIGQGEKVFAEILKHGPFAEITGEFTDPPSPYLDGTLDEFMDLLPIVETVRGCPYRCAYCSGGTNKLNVRDKEVVKKEIDYLVKNSRHKAIDLSDTNFGMCGERDLEIINHIKDSGLYLAGYATSRKKDKVSIDVVKTISDITGELYLGLQTLTKEALKASCRSNIAEENLMELVSEARRLNRPICVDLIFGLPYETLNSFLDTLTRLFEMGIKAPVIYQLRLLPFTGFWDKREEYGYETRFRPFNSRYGIIDGKRIVEAEEIVVASNWFTLDDYITLRAYGLLTTLGEYGVFDISPEDIGRVLLRGSDWLNDYKNFARKELFETSEDVYNCNPEEFFKLNLGFAGYAIFEDRKILEEIGNIIGQEPRPAPKIDDTYNNLPIYHKCERILLYSPRNIWR